MGRAEGGHARLDREIVAISDMREPAGTRQYAVDEHVDGVDESSAPIASTVWVTAAVQLNSLALRVGWFALICTLVGARAEDAACREHLTAKGVAELVHERGAM